MCTLPTHWDCFKIDNRTPILFNCFLFFWVQNQSKNKLSSGFFVFYSALFHFVQLSAISNPALNGKKYVYYENVFNIELLDYLSIYQYKG